MEPKIALVSAIILLTAVALYEFVVRERVIAKCAKSQFGALATVPQRIFLVLVVSTSCWLLANMILIESFPASRDLQPYADRTVIVFALTVAWLVWSRSRLAPSVAMSRAILGTAIVGGGAFVVSALSGPILFPTKINQGILVGLFLVAPAFAILGGVVGLLEWSFRSSDADSRFSKSL